MLSFNTPYRRVTWPLDPRDDRPRPESPESPETPRLSSTWRLLDFQERNPNWLNWSVTNKAINNKEASEPRKPTNDFCSVGQYNTIQWRNVIQSINDSHTHASLQRIHRPIVLHATSRKKSSLWYVWYGEKSIEHVIQESNVTRNEWSLIYCYYTWSVLWLQYSFYLLYSIIR